MISREEVDSVAQLARLKLSDWEAVSLQKDISNILEYVGQISGAGASASLQGDRGRSADAPAPPLLHNVLREDTPRLPAQAGDPLAGKREKIIAAFPRQEREYLVVRKIIQKDE